MVVKALPRLSGWEGFRVDQLAKRRLYFVGMCVLIAECLLLVPPISYSAGLSLPYSVIILTFVKLSVDRQFEHLILFDTEIAFSIVACLERI
jgi:hypothetical protein